MNILSFVHCEKVKLVKSNVFWVVLGAFGALPLMLGIIAGLNDGATWESYLSGILGSTAALLVAGFLFTAAWVFGREYTDNTISELLVKPVSKFYVVISKFVVIFSWDIILAVFTFGIIAGMGAIIGLGGDAAVVLSSFLKFSGTALLIMVVSTTGALLANITKGYLAPLGMTFVIVILSNLMVQIGAGAYFPWTIPALILRDGAIGLVSVAIVALTGIIGFLGTVAWWRFTEQE